MNYIFELPVYTMSKEKYEEKRKKRLELEIKKYQPLDEKHQYYRRITDILKDVYCPEWEYNQIIGYIKFFFQGNSIQGDFWWIQQKRYQLAIGRKVFKYLVHYPQWDIHLSKTISNEKINEILLEKIPQEYTGFLDKYYIDMSFLRKFGKYINWHDFMQ